jgi:hypothetical protein
MGRSSWSYFCHWSFHWYMEVLLYLKLDSKELPGNFLQLYFSMKEITWWYNTFQCLIIGKPLITTTYDNTYTTPINLELWEDALHTRQNCKANKIKCFMMSIFIIDTTAIFCDSNQSVKVLKLHTCYFNSRYYIFCFC